MVGSALQLSYLVDPCSVCDCGAQSCQTSSRGERGRRGAAHIKGSSISSMQAEMAMKEGSRASDSLEEDSIRCNFGRSEAPRKDPPGGFFFLYFILFFPFIVSKLEVACRANQSLAG